MVSALAWLLPAVVKCWLLVALIIVKNFLLNNRDMKVFTLKKRRDFLKAASELKAVVNGVVVQAAFTLPDNNNEDICFVGYTATKKLGKAHIRNRVKRRLRAAAQNVLPLNAVAGAKYVLIGRHNTADLNFAYLVKKLTEAIKDINSQINMKNEAK